MELIVNGNPLQTSGEQARITVADLIVQMKLAGRAVAVEVNEQLIPKRLHEQTELKPGDRVEVVTLVGGG